MLQLWGRFLVTLSLTNDIVILNQAEYEYLRSVIEMEKLEIINSE
ncbi:hypothetical protein [Neobacillus sp. FSL H8-0543]